MLVFQFASLSLAKRSWVRFHLPPTVLTTCSIPTQQNSLSAWMFFCSTSCPGLQCTAFAKSFCMSTRWVRFSVSSVHNLSSRDEKNSWLSRDSNPRLLGGKQECYPCATQPPNCLKHLVKKPSLESFRCSLKDPERIFRSFYFEWQNNRCFVSIFRRRSAEERKKTKPAKMLLRCFWTKNKYK